MHDCIYKVQINEGNGWKSYDDFIDREEAIRAAQVVCIPGQVESRVMKCSVECSVQSED